MRTILIICLLIGTQLHAQGDYLLASLQQVNNSVPTPIYGTLIYGGDFTGTDPALAFDNNLSTFPDSGTTTGQWLGQDFGTSQTISEVHVYGRDSFPERLTGVIIEYSDNSTDWTTVGTITTGLEGLNVVTFAPESHRYWRINWVHPSVGYANANEIYFFE